MSKELQFKRNKADLFWGLHAHSSFGGKFRRCIDVGGFDGEYSSMYASIFENVETFEPNIHMFQRFKLNTLPYTNLTHHILGVSSYIGSATFYHNNIHMGRSTIIESRVDNDNDFYEPMVINVVTIDSMNFSTVDFIKIDVEGSDGEVLKGALETIKTYKPTIQIEQNKMKDLLIENGYKQINTNKFKYCHDFIWAHESKMLFQVE